MGKDAADWWRETLSILLSRYCKEGAKYSWFGHATGKSIHKNSFQHRLVGYQRKPKVAALSKANLGRLFAGNKGIVRVETEMGGII